MIVVDNDSTDASVASLADLDVTTIAVEVNRGFAAGCNIGYRAGTAPFVLFLNPDARAEPELIGRLRAVLEAAPAAGAVAPRILDEDGNLDFSLRRFPRRRSTFAQALFLHRALPQATWVDEVVRDPAAYERAWSPDWVSGACLLVRRSVLEQIGGFDEGYFHYSEDTDLCRRIRDAGFDIRYEPSAVVVHLGGRSTPRPALLPTLAAARVRYVRRHDGRTCRRARANRRRARCGDTSRGRSRWDGAAPRARASIAADGERRARRDRLAQRLGTAPRRPVGRGSIHRSREATVRPSRSRSSPTLPSRRRAMKQRTCGGCTPPCSARRARRWPRSSSTTIRPTIRWRWPARRRQ